MFDFTCLVSKGGYLNEEDRMFLSLAGCDMAQKGQIHRKIKDDGIIGDIFTNFKSAVIGSISGVVFEAEITTPKGDIRVRYIVSKSDLRKNKSELSADNGRWQNGDGHFAKLIWEILGKALKPSQEYYS
jgi:hypothetical protein